MLEHVGRVGEHRPPVARRAGGGARLGDRVPVAEQAVVHGQDDRRLDLGPGDLTQSWHGRNVYQTRRSHAPRKAFTEASDGVQSSRGPTSVLDGMVARCAPGPSSRGKGSSSGSGARPAHRRAAAEAEAQRRPLDHVIEALKATGVFRSFVQGLNSLTLVPPFSDYCADLRDNSSLHRLNRRRDRRHMKHGKEFAPLATFDPGG